MKYSKLIIFNFVSVLIMIIFLISIYNSIKNVIILNLNFISSNLTIRENFFEENNVYLKGTHDSGKRYFDIFYNNFENLSKLQISKIKNTFKKVNISDIHKYNYLYEDKIIEILQSLSKITIVNRKKTGIYISKDINIFWNLSCDTLMVPFIVPAITNMVMLKGLPITEKSSCYGHKNQYGYGRYKDFNKLSLKERLFPDELCTYAKEEGLENVIELIKIDNEFDYKIYYCK